MNGTSMVCSFGYLVQVEPVAVVNASTETFDAALAWVRSNASTFVAVHVRGHLFLVLKYFTITTTEPIFCLVNSQQHSIVVLRITTHGNFGVITAWLEFVLFFMGCYFIVSTAKPIVRLVIRTTTWSLTSPFSSHTGIPLCVSSHFFSCSTTSS